MVIKLENKRKEREILFVKMLEKMVPELQNEFKMYNEMLREQDFLDTNLDHKDTLETLKGHFIKVVEIKTRAEKFQF